MVEREQSRGMVFVRYDIPQLVERASSLFSLISVVESSAYDTLLTMGEKSPTFYLTLAT